MDGAKGGDLFVFFHGGFRVGGMVCGGGWDSAFVNFGSGNVRGVCAECVVVGRAAGCDETGAASRADLSGVGARKEKDLTPSAQRNCGEKSENGEEKDVYRRDAEGAEKGNGRTKAQARLPMLR